MNLGRPHRKFIPTKSLTRTGKVIFFSDVHIGAIEHRGVEFDEALRWAMENEALVVLGGDLIENATAGNDKDCGSKLMGQAMMPTEQIKVCRAKMIPFAKRDRIVCMVDGNHEERSGRNALYVPMDDLADQLGVPYLANGGMVRLVNDKQEYVVAVHHGSSGARNIYLELKRMADLYPQADVVAAGHNHALNAESFGAWRVGEDSYEEYVERWMVRTGSYQGYAEYVRRGSLTPGRVGSPFATFHTDRHRVDVDKDTLSWQP